jgi:hypothetical protein
MLKLGQNRYTNNDSLPGFFYKWDNVNTEPALDEDDFFPLREWQKRASDKLEDKSYRIVNAPTGSGKSLLLCYLSILDMLNNPDLKVIIAVPQTIIASGFRDLKLEFPDGSEHSWNIDSVNDLLSKEGKITEKSMVKRAIAFLKEEDTLQDPEDLQTRVLLCSHQTVVALMKKLNKPKKLNLFKKLLKNTSWIIDESHHAKNKLYDDLEYEDEDNTENDICQNELGKLIKIIYDRKGTILTLPTATFFRGDRLSILTPKMKAKFERFNLAFDEYLKTLKYLESFSFNFMFYNLNPIENITNLFNTRVGKTIIYLAHTGSRCSSGDKYQEVQDIINCIKDKKSEIDEDENGVFHVTRKGKDITILDLVDDTSMSKRDIRKRYIESKAKKKDGPDVIIAMDMFKEGANYDYLDRAILIGPRNSLNQMMQTIGRLFRDAESKKHVEIIQLFPRVIDIENDVLKNKLNDSFNGIVSSMLLENVLVPNLSNIFSSGRAGEKLDNTYNTCEIESNAFNDLVTDMNQNKDIFNQVLKIICRYRIEHGNNGVREYFDRIVKSTLENNKIEVEQEILQKVSDVIWFMISRRRAIVDNSGIDVSHIDINVIDYDPIGDFLAYASGACDGSLFEKYKRFFKSCRTPEEWVPIAEKIAKENGGILPNPKWLQKNVGYGLYEAMKKYPEKFDHIKQKKLFKTVEEWVEIADKLVKDNDGILPNVKWLIDNSYNMLYETMRNYPKKFDHVKQQKIFKDPEEWAKIAEKLVKNNNGILPNRKWLRENKYSGLDQMIKIYPEKFAHIKQKSLKRRTIDEWVSVAEKLVKENNGILPGSTWLRENDYGGLDQMMYKYPDEFSHIKQKRKHRTIEEWVEIAEKLVKENDGILPRRKWLLKNKYYGLLHAVKRYPDEFAHIKQGRKHKTIEEWVLIAEKIAKENGGILPNPKWLQNNKYGGLYEAMKRYPDEFSHIKQKRKHRTIEEWVEIAEKLVKDNDGILPNCTWLRENDCSGLYKMIKKHPEKFSHISRIKRAA